jgi:Fe-S-cluster containining protein
MVDTSNLVSSLLDAQLGYCGEFRKEGHCCKVLDNGDVSYCPMLYYGELYNGCTIHMKEPINCRITDFIQVLIGGSN